MHFAMVMPLILFATVAFIGAFFPRVLPRMTNQWYSIIGAQTRVVEADYAKMTTRIASFVLFVVVAVWIFIRAL